MFGFEEKYINPFTDYGFIKRFGEEPILMATPMNR